MDRDARLRTPSHWQRLRKKSNCGPSGSRSPDPTPIYNAAPYFVHDEGTRTTVRNSGGWKEGGAYILCGMVVVTRPVKVPIDKEKKEEKKREQGNEGNKQVPGHVFFVTRPVRDTTRENLPSAVKSEESECGYDLTSLNGFGRASSRHQVSTCALSFSGAFLLFLPLQMLLRPKVQFSPDTRLFSSMSDVCDCSERT